MFNFKASKYGILLKNLEHWIFLKSSIFANFLFNKVQN